MSDSSINNKRIAKNTIILYIRTLIILLVSLYSSRVILNALGVDDFGIYNAVGGVVAMFNVISGALSAAVSRFLTYELGKGNRTRLRTIFSTSINIQIGLCFVVIVIGESIGTWFLNYEMNIPSERMVAANWVLQCSLLTFCINLISIPYNACIISHEKMDVFAYISIFETVLKLIVCFAIVSSPWDKLILYALLLVSVAILICFIYSLYCNRQFEESKYQFVFDKRILKEMTSFAGWNFFTNSAYIFNTQGINLLINIFFDVTVNAARGIATQVESAILMMVNSFTTALNPQITKNYASGNRIEMLSLVFRGAKFSYLLLFIIALPVMLEAEFILTIWLKLVPIHTVNFVRLAIIASLVNIIGKTGYTASMATGKIRRYVLWVTSVGCMAFPLTWLSFSLGAPSEASYFVFICVYILVEAIRLWVMKDLLDFPVSDFLKEVVLRVMGVTSLAIIIPITFIEFFEPSWLRFIMSTIICMTCSTFSIYIVGLTVNERQMILKVVYNKIGEIRNYCNKIR